jgi:hypothetical protein
VRQQDTHAHPLALVSIAAPEDTALLAQWEAHLRPLQQAGFISVWSEVHLTPGTDRVQECQRQIDGADMVLLLLSVDFFDSPDCLVLMEQALQCSHSSTTRVIPLLLRSVAWQESPLAKLAHWPPNGVSITQWTDQDAAWDACVQELRRLLGRRVSESLRSEHIQKQTDPDWQRMLLLLLRSYKELLDQSLHDAAWMELDLSARPDMVSNVTNLLFRLPQGGERLLAPGTSILDAYDEAEGELLILGAPGAGKSTLLLDLAQQLVRRALADHTHLLPVIFRLSSWAAGRPSLDDWMVEQLKQTYTVPRVLCERWVTQGRLLPLLDGLDEMEEAARPACIAAINTYRQTHLAPLVVCSRQTEYETAATRKRLVLQSSVIVQPLSEVQIEGYLRAAGPSFAGVRAALHQQSALWELATTPLMLSVLLQTYQGTTASEIIQQGTDLERQVWTDYVARQVQEKGNATRYPLERTRMWLTYLAQQLRAHQQTTFYAEHLHIDWLASTQQRSATRLTTLIPSIVIGVCVNLLVTIFIGGGSFGPYWTFLLQMGISGAFIGGCLSLSLVERPAILARGLQVTMVWRLCNAILLGLLLAASFGLALLGVGYSGSNWLLYQGIPGLGSVLSGWVFQALLNHQSQQREPAAHTRLHLRGRLTRWMDTLGLLHVWQAVATLGIGIGLSYGLSIGLLNGLLYGQSNGLLYGLIFGLKYGLSVSVTVILARSILDTSLGTLHFAERVHWTWRSLFRPEHLRTSVTVTATIFLFRFLFFWLTGGLLYGLFVGLFVGLLNGLLNGPFFGLLYWLILGLYQGMKQEHLEDQDRSQFNQGIRRSLYNGLLISLISAIITLVIDILNVLSSGVLTGLLSAYVNKEELSKGLSIALKTGLNTGPSVLIVAIVVMWALSGGLTILRHYVIRWLLAHHRTFPFRAQAFLDDATTRILLRRVGGGYSFIHRRLQDYFADAVVPPSQN